MTSSPSQEPRRRKGHTDVRPRVRVWYCELYGEGGWVHACPACWIGRLFFTVMVLAPAAWMLKELLLESR